MLVEEEKKFNHYYGEEYVDTVSRIDKLNKKELYLQDDLITNLIILFLINSKSNDYDLLKSVNSIFKMKNYTKKDILKRIKLLYDRYHGFLDEGKSEFWYMSCKKPEIKNILTLFQNNKQIYCNIDNIYDCSLHSSNDPNFDNPSCYDQIKYLKTYKKLLEYSVDFLYGGKNETTVNSENNMIIDNPIDNENNDESYPISVSRSEDKKNKENGNNAILNNENNINNDLISNASSKIQSYNNSKEIEENNSEIILEYRDGSTKIISLNKKKEEEIPKNIINMNNTNNTNVVNNNINKDIFKNHIIDLILEFNQTLKNLKCHSSVVSQIRKVKFMLKEEKKTCSELCYKNFLKCDESIYNQSFILSKDKEFPVVYELLLIKFLQIVKFDPCRIYKLMKPFINEKDMENNTKIQINCSDIYLHLLSQKFRLRNIIKKEFFDLNIKERELGKKNRASLTPIQTKKIEENHLKKQNLTYIPCVHFGNEICDEKCPCSKRGYCEIYCKCNQILCKFSFHGCHCSKGDCTTNHCPCYTNGRECNPRRCKNCIIINNNDRCKNIQLQHDFESKLIVGMSDIAGWGLFANEDIKKDSLIGEYKGELINDDIVNKRDKFKDYEGSTYMFKLDDEYTVDSRRMGNMLRYANHSKINSNSYTKIIFSRGHRKIGLFAKKNIRKGEEILFDYDGQGILVKQFSWINHEKKLINHYSSSERPSNNTNTLNNNSNLKNINDSNGKINNEEKANIITNINFNNNIINNNINIKNNPINTNLNNNYFSKRKMKTKRVGIPSTINLINDSSNKDKISLEKNNNIKKEISLKEIIIKDNINNNINIKNDSENELIEKNEQKKEHINLIDMLSDKNFCSKKSGTKNLFKTEENEIKDIRSNYENKKYNNIFDFMIQLRENLSKGERTRFISKKRNEPKFENKFQTNKLNLNLNSNNVNKENNIIKKENNIIKKENNIINNENKDNTIIDDVFQKNQNLKSALFKEVKKYIDEKEEMQNEKEMKINIEINKEENEFKLRTPVFAGESKENNKSMNNFCVNKNKISYNFITCEYFNNNPLTMKIKHNNSNSININNNYNSAFKIPELSNKSINYNNSINNCININNKNIFTSFNKNINTINSNINLANNSQTIKLINNIYNLSTIRISLQFDNPIINDFSFYSPVNTDKLKIIENLEVKPLDLNDSNFKIDFDKDICGYLAKNISYKNSRIFKDYLDCFENRSFYCFISELNSDLYIISKGPFYNQIDNQYYFNRGKTKKLFFIIKNK